MSEKDESYRVSRKLWAVTHDNYQKLFDFDFDPRALTSPPAGC